MSSSFLLPQRNPQPRYVVFPRRHPLPRNRPTNHAPRPEITLHCGAEMSMEQRLFLRWLLCQGGLDFRAYRMEMLIRRLPACLRTLRVSTLSEARRVIESSPAALARAISAMIIGVTSFFRDEEVFQNIQATILPALRRKGGSIRIWCAACADGSELYSVAMCLAEAGLLEKASLLGTDCRSEAIAAARAGLYDQQAVGRLEPERIARFFQREEGKYRVCGALRTSAQWRTGNLLHVREPGAWDMILCRNAIMYMRPESAAAAWSVLEASLRPGGFLVAGKAERPLGVHTLSAKGNCIYRRN